MAIQLQRDLSFDMAGWRRLVDAVIQLITGRQNSVLDVTLAVAPATGTVISFPNCSKDCRVFLFPQTAHAAALFASGGVYITKLNIGQGSFVITHPSSANSDNQFSAVCIGG